MQSTYTRGTTYFELSNHTSTSLSMRLGNVLAVVTDRKLAQPDGSSGISYYRPDIVSATDYYLFGFAMEGRGFSSSNYRYGFNGMEKDNEMKGSGNSYDFGARIYDSRLGRFLSVDRYKDKFAFQSGYSFASNSPVAFIDKGGDSTAYFSENGTLLWVSHDGLDNSINIVKNENLLIFYVFMKLSDYFGKSDNNETNKTARSFGVNYNLVKYIQWAKNIHKGEFNPDGTRNEKKSWLYENNGDIEIFNNDDPKIGGKNDSGDPSRHPSPLLRSQKIHTHPIESGLRRNPSRWDMLHGTLASTLYRDVIIEVANNKKGETIITGIYLFGNSKRETGEYVSGVQIIRFQVLNDNEPQGSKNFENKDGEFQ